MPVEQADNIMLNGVTGILIQVRAIKLGSWKAWIQYLGSCPELSHDMPWMLVAAVTDVRLAAIVCVSFEEEEMHYVHTASKGLSE